jgi:hypothetical protein
LLNADLVIADLMTADFDDWPIEDCGSADPMAQSALKTISNQQSAFGIQHFF